MTHIYILYHSGYGHTKLQAEAVYRGAASLEGVEAHLLTAEETSADIATAEGYGLRVATVAQQLNRRRAAA